MEQLYVNVLSLASQISCQFYSQPLECTALAIPVNKNKALITLHHDVPDSLVPDFRFLQFLVNPYTTRQTVTILTMLLQGV